MVTLALNRCGATRCDARMSCGTTAYPPEKYWCGFLRHRVVALADLLFVVRDATSAMSRSTATTATTLRTDLSTVRRLLADVCAGSCGGSVEGGGSSGGSEGPGASGFPESLFKPSRTPSLNASQTPMAVEFMRRRRFATRVRAVCQTAVSTASYVPALTAAPAVISSGKDF